jgi:hypothetical protein
MMDLEVYAIVHCGDGRWLNYQTSNGSETDRCQQADEGNAHQAGRVEHLLVWGRRIGAVIREDLIREATFYRQGFG